jgi:hypothetical protein
MVEAAELRYEKRMFECLGCKHSDNVTVAAPLNDRSDENAN